MGCPAIAETFNDMLIDGFGFRKIGANGQLPLPLPAMGSHADDFG